MNVLELLASRHFTGPAESILRLMEGLAAKAHRVAFAHTQRPPGTLADKLSGAEYSVLKNVSLKRKGFLIPSAMKDIIHLRRFVDGIPADEPIIVHTHTSHDHWVGLALNKVRPDRVVLIRSVHETRLAAHRMSDIPLYSACDGIIVISDAMKKQLLRSYHLHPDRVVVVRGSVDSERYRPDLDASAIYKEIDAAPGDPIYGIVSRIKAGRGHIMLVDALAPLAREHPALRLMIVGRGEGRDSLEKHVRTGKHEGWVRFLGYRRDDLPEIYNAMTAKIILGEGSDGTCRAALEAMSCGTPVIAARIGALPETVHHGTNGFLIDPEDNAELRVCAARFIAEQHTARIMGLAARKSIEERFTVRRFIDEMESFFMRWSQTLKTDGAHQ